MSEKIDLLDRGAFVDNVIKIVNQLSENKMGCCFAIEGSWGIGKTFVIEEIEKKLNVVLSEETAYDKYFVFHYNCWQYDYYEEPAVAIISAMLSSIKEDKAVANQEIDGLVRAGWDIAKDKLKEIAGLYLENKIGVNLISLFQDIEEKRQNNDRAIYEFDDLFNFGQTIEKVRQCLEEIAKERTLVLVVDELDRCIPLYAIKVLERLHHIFDGLENVVVIMAIDRKQLEHSVEEMFGGRTDENSMDIEKYLRKFISFSLRLDNGKINESFPEKYKYYIEKFDANQEEIKQVSEMMSEWFCNIGIREQEKIIEKASLVHSIVCSEPVHITVLCYELIYEIVRLVSVGSLKNVAIINKATYSNMEKRIGQQKIQFLKDLLQKAYSPTRLMNYNGKQYNIIDYTFEGEIIWIFASLFNDPNSYRVDTRYNEEKMKVQLEVAKKYHEFREMIN